MSYLSQLVIQRNRCWAQRQMRQRQQDNFSDLLKKSLHENRQAGNRNSIYKQRVARREDQQSVSGDGLVKYLQV